MVRHKLALVLACSAMALGTAARAQSVTATPGGFSMTQLGDHGTITQPIGTGDLSDDEGAIHFSSTNSITGPLLSFESASAATGLQASMAQSVSQISLGVNNNTDGPFAPTLNSQITAAGFGLYVGNNAGGACFTAPTACAQTRNAADTFSQFARPADGQVQTLAGATFSFAITQGADTLYALGGSISLVEDANGNVSVVSNTREGQDFLTGFQSQALGNPNTALGYNWNPTNISVDLDSIGSGQGAQINYSATVNSFSNVACLADGSCVMAYSGFGDPIGGGGEIGSNALIFRGFNTQGPGLNFINGLNFSPETLELPTFGLDGLNFGAPGAPEPASWALVIIGFGAMGAALRRRRSAVAAA